MRVSRIERAKSGTATSQIKRSTGSIDLAARKISDGNNDLSQRTEHQAASLEETAAPWKRSPPR